MARLLTMIGVLILLLPVLPARGQECENLVVAAVKFDGCGLSRCSERKTQARLVAVADLMGRKAAEGTIEKAGERLLKTGFFAELKVTCSAVNAMDARVTFVVVPNRYVRKVVVKGVKILFSADLEKRIFLHTGAIFNPDRKESAERLDRQVANLTSFMRQQGLDTASVEVEKRLVEPNFVDLLFRVDEGKVTRVERVSIELKGPWDEPAPNQYSCPQVTKRQLLRAAAVERGSLYTGRTARQVKARVREFLQQYGFQAPRVKVTFASKTEIITVNVRVNKCYAIHILEREEAVDYRDTWEKVKEEEVYAALPFRESGVFDRREAHLGIEELLIYHKTRGYLFADVEMQYVDYREMYEAWPYPLVGGVTYRVTRGQPSEIRELSFPGLSETESELLLAIMQTRRYDFFDVGGFLQVEQLLADMDVIKKHYADRGFFRMSYPLARFQDDQIRVQIIRRKDRTIWRYHYLDKAFDVIKPDWENAIRIEVPIERGEGSTVGNLTIKGVEAIPRKTLHAGLPVQAGGEFSARLVRATKAAIEAQYQALGRPIVITASCVGVEPDVPAEECDVTKIQSRQIDLEFRVVEGKQQLMGRVLVVGNLKTTRSVVERDFPDEGEPFDRIKVDNAVRRLRNTGVFSSVRLVTLGPEEVPPRKTVDVVVQVEEAKTRQIEISAGFQKMYDRSRSGRGDEPISDGIRDLISTSLHATGSPLSGSALMQSLTFPDVLLMGEVAYTDKNFLGFAKSLKIPVSYGFTTRDPARYAAFRPTYYDPRFLSSDISMRLMPFIVYDRALSRVDKFEFGVENELSYQVWKGINLSLTTRVARGAWKYPEGDEFSPQEWEFSLTPGIRFDFRDNPINPSSGFYAMGRIKYLNAYELVPIQDGDATDWVNERENFFQYELQGQFYMNFRKAVILAFNARYGHTFTFDEEKGGQGRLPPTHLFYLGGTTGVRGFPARGVLQYKKDGSPRLADDPTTAEPDLEVVDGGGTMVNASLELRFPLLRNAGLWAAAFLDVGAVAADLGSTWLHAKSFRFSTGVGLRWLIGDQIPIRLDYGFVLDPRCNKVDSTGECIGQDDAGALDFGLLYTF
jgi:outer membrane protein assembly factor BamA